MRVATSMMQQLGVSAMLEQQAKMLNTQLQLASGRRILTPADDPAGASRALNLNQALESTKQFQANSQFALSRLNLEESTLSSATDLLDRVRVLAVQAKNASQTNETRRFIASEVRERFSELLQIANTRDGQGEYIFAGTRTRTQPFVLENGEVVYNGDQTRRNIQIGPSRQVTDGDPGWDVFMAVRNGDGSVVSYDGVNNRGNAMIQQTGIRNFSDYVPDEYQVTIAQNSDGALVYLVSGTEGGYLVPPPPDPLPPGYDPLIDSLDDAPLFTDETGLDSVTLVFNGIEMVFEGMPQPGDTFTVRPAEQQSIFRTIQNFIAALDAGVNDEASNARFNNAMNRVLSDIDQGLGRMLETQTSIGGRVLAIESQNYINESYILQTRETLSEVEDLDYAEAISRFELQRVGLQAAQQAYVKVQGLSLFNYI